MTIHQKPRDVLPAFRQKLLPPKRMSEADSLLLEIRDKIAKAQNISELRDPLATLLADSLHEIQLEKTSRTHPGMIGTLATECEFAAIE
jgi:predicted N-formylglutamate amidohydrolase